MNCLIKIARVMLAGVLALGVTAGARAAEPAKEIAKAGEVKFAMHRVGNFRSESCCVADFNKDGKLDIAAGPYLYLAPDFKPTKIRDIKGSVDEKGMGYYYDFMNEPLDADGDGNIDIVACDWFQKACWWYRNPGPGKAGLWEENLMVKNGNYETAMLADVDGDGKAREVLPHVAQTVWYEFVKGADGKVTTAVHQISDKKMDFGVGAGDLNGDGRPDIIRPNAWFEAPADPRNGKWIEHPIDFHIPQPNPKIAKHLSMFLVEDVNGDGLNDIVYTMAHGYGICWVEQVRQGSEITFKRHMIDDTWTQAHAIALADLDGDGVKELITGKRFRAHNGNDPEEDKPLGVYYYKPVKQGGEVTWEKHVISYDQGVGSALNVVTVDLDGDGDLDIVVTGKYGGPVWFENKTK